jgi:hypothetical protein
VKLYLSPGHRDNPGQGCASAALLPELVRESSETRRLYTEHFLALIRQVAATMPAGNPDPEGSALALFATLIGTLQLARAVDGAVLSDRIVSAGTDAARTLAQTSHS